MEWLKVPEGGDPKNTTASKKDAIFKPPLVPIKLLRHYRYTASCGLLQNTRILNCESFSAPYFVQPMRCLPLETAHDLTNQWANAANPISPHRSFQGNQQRYRHGLHALERQAQKRCRISTFFNTLDCILRNATKTKSVLTKAVAKKEKGRIKRR